MKFIILFIELYSILEPIEHSIENSNYIYCFELFNRIKYCLNRKNTLIKANEIFKVLFTFGFKASFLD